MSDYFRLPKLGPHYAKRWAKEDLEMERVKGSGSADGNDGSGQDSGSSKMLRKAGDSVNSEDSPFGELTQRLVAGLLEENIVTPIEETLELGGKKGQYRYFFISPPTRFPSAGPGNAHLNSKGGSISTADLLVLTG